MAGSSSISSSSTIDLRGLELVLQQRERVANDLVEVGLAELGGGGAREIEQAVGDLGGAEALLGDLVEHRRQAGIAACSCLASICA